jgi:tetratricopeptide (TPR) repeat protein
MERRYGEAKLLYKKALNVWEKALGPNDPNVATVLENMAELYKELGETDKAEKLDSRARKIRQSLGQR